MLIRIKGAREGIKEYLERGHKQGREHSRDELDERVILAGDLDFTDRLIHEMDSEGDRYLHITLAFKEDEVAREVLLNITREFKEFAFSAYEDEEFSFYAEAHLPKIKSYVNQKTGELVERKPHIHIVIPKVNLLSGGHLNPVGLVEHNERFIDAFQEHINNKHGLASPKDHRRVEFTNASDMIQRYKDDQFDGQNKEVKRAILDALLERNIRDYGAFAELVAEFGDARTRNAGKGTEYQNVKPVGQGKGINLKDYVFSREFIELPGEDKRARLAAEIQHKYEVEGAARRDPATVAAGLADWHGYRAREVKYLNSGNKKQYKRYQDADTAERSRMLADLARKFYEKYEEPRHAPERFQQNPFEHTYGFKQPERGLGRGRDGPEAERADGRVADAERTVDGGSDGAVAERGPGGPYRPHSGIDRGRGAFDADLLRRADTDDLTRRRIAFAASGQYDPFPAAARPPAQTINGVRALSSVNVAGDPAGPQMLLQDHARIQLDHHRSGGVDPLRRHRHRQRRHLTTTGREDDSSISQLVRDCAQRRQAGAGGELAEFHQIKAKLDAARLLADLSVSHGVIIDKYRVSVEDDGSARILCGKRKLNVSDFLTKEMCLPWSETADILRDAYARQVGEHPALAPRQAPCKALWRQFQDERKARGGQRQLLAQQVASERARRDALRERLARARNQAEALPGAKRKAALSVARMEYVTGDSSLRQAIRAERQRFRAPVREQYEMFLHGRAQGGDERALAELRRMAHEAPLRQQPELGSISLAEGRPEPNAMFYRGKQVRYLVHRNGDVVYSLAGRAIIQDQGNKLVMLQTDRLAIEAALRLANVKFCGVITVGGIREFQERSARIAAEAGVQVTFQDKSLERIRELRAAELASERVKRAEHRHLGRQFVEHQTTPAPPAAMKVTPRGRTSSTPTPKRDVDKGGPER